MKRFHLEKNSQIFICFRDPRVSKEIQEEDGIQYSYHVYEKTEGSDS